MDQISELRKKLEAERQDLFNQLKEIDDKLKKNQENLAAIEKVYGPVRPRNTVLQVDDAVHGLNSSMVKSELAQDQQNYIEGPSGQTVKNPLKGSAD